MSFHYKKISEGMIAANEYVLWDDCGNAVFIDAGDPLPQVKKIVEDNNLTVKYIILTQVHFDHICGLPFQRKEYPDAKVLCHSGDKDFFGNPYANASTLFGSEKKFEGADATLEDGDIITLSPGHQLEIISTPGHTPGSICIKAGGVLFTGDTLFCGNFGRTDLGYGDSAQLSKSIDLLYSMDDDLEVQPGHGTKTTIKRERLTNPFLDW